MIQDQKPTPISNTVREYNAMRETASSPDEFVPFWAFSEEHGHLDQDEKDMIAYIANLPHLERRALAKVSEWLITVSDKCSKTGDYRPYQNALLETEQRYNKELKSLQDGAEQ